MRNCRAVRVVLPVLALDLLCGLSLFRDQAWLFLSLIVARSWSICVISSCACVPHIDTGLKSRVMQPHLCFFFFDFMR